MKKRKIGEVAPNKIPIIDRHGRTRGNVGKRATAACVARFGVGNAKLGKHQGRVCWIEGTCK